MSMGMTWDALDVANGWDLWDSWDLWVTLISHKSHRSHRIAQPGAGRPLAMIIGRSARTLLAPKF